MIVPSYCSRFNRTKKRLQFNQERECNEIGEDPFIRLDDLAELIPALQKKYGKQARIFFTVRAINIGDAPIVSMIRPTKKVKK